jgi:hypothetical protein
MHRLPTATATLLCTASLVAACSSSGGHSAGVTSHTGGGSTGHAGSVSSAAAGAATGAATAPSKAVGGGSGDAAAFCKLITKNNAVMRDISAGDKSAAGVDTTKLLHDMDAALAVAPAEIKSDMATVVAFDRQIFTQRKELKSTPQLEAALQHYGAWVQSHCSK